MRRAAIREKCITIARKTMREGSTARVDGRSVFIKRYPGKNYKIIMVHVTKKQRAVRDMFADANVLAKGDMSKWNRVRHWERYAKKHKKLGAYRAAVSFYYKKIRELGSDKANEQFGQRIPVELDNREFDTVEDMRVFKKENIFFWVKFDTVEECRETLIRLAAG